MMGVGLGGEVKGRRFEQKSYCVWFVNVGYDLFRKDDNIYHADESYCHSIPDARDGKLLGRVDK